MKSKRKYARQVLKLNSGSSFVEEAGELETLLAKKPAQLTLEMIGTGEIPADSVLLMRSILLARSPRTHVTTHARSSLQGAAVLVWLLGDTRLIRDDAKLFFRSTAEFDAGPGGKEVWKDRDLFNDNSKLEEADYAQALRAINEFLPVRELADWPVEVPALRQFGLVDNQKVDRFLMDVFQKKTESVEKSPRGTRKSRSQKEDFSI